MDQHGIGRERRKLRLVVWAAVAIAVVVTLAPGSAWAEAARELTGAQRLALRRTPVVDVFESARVAVVNISATQVVEDRSPFGRLFDGFFEAPGDPFFGRRRDVRRTSLGSGFVVHPAGYVVTNAHVVARSVERKVIFDDEREYDAEVIAMDTERDLAVLRITSTDGETFPALPMGRSDDLMVGETAIAIGNPFGFQHTVTVGVVSALNRELAAGPNVTFRGLVQTDAAIHPGNSGGPLLNVLGELIGVNTAIRQGAENLGFAIPVDQLREALPELLDVERRYGLAIGMRLSAGKAPRVVSLAEGGPAHEAGVQLGDRLTAVEGTPVTSVLDYPVSLIGRSPGETLRLTLDRDGEAVEVSIAIAERPRPDGQALVRAKFGVSVLLMTQADARELGLGRLQGLVVREVEAGSPAARIGLRRGDIIAGIGRFAVGSLDALGELLEPVTTGERLTLTVVRIEGRTIFRQTVPIVAR